MASLADFIADFKRRCPREGVAPYAHVEAFYNYRAMLAEHLEWVAAEKRRLAYEAGAEKRAERRAYDKERRATQKAERRARLAEYFQRHEQEQAK